jgi:calcium uptake protein 1, mitochondrial
LAFPLLTYRTYQHQQ